jgi:hypothetical protein
MPLEPDVSAELDQILAAYEKDDPRSSLRPRYGSRYVRHRTVYEVEAGSFSRGPNSASAHARTSAAARRRDCSVADHVQE